MRNIPKIIEAVHYEDERGILQKPFLHEKNFVPKDIYVSTSKNGVFRGLHYQMEQNGFYLSQC